MMHRVTAARRRLPRAAALAALAVLPLSACDLNVVDPDVVRPGQLVDEAALPTLLSGALGDFSVAYGGSRTDAEGIILAGGLRGDEWLNTDTFDTRRDIDLGRVLPDNGSNEDVFRNLQRARRSAEFAAAQYAALAPDAPGHAQALSLAGFAWVLLGEHYCSGVPVSTLNEEGVFEFGQPLTTQQIFEGALARFDEALAIATAAEDEDMANLARVGRGRALLNLNRFAEAAAAVAGVPVDFSFELEASTNTDRQNNGVFYFNNLNYRWGLADEEGGVGLPYVSANDPRLPWYFTDETGLDGETPIYFQDKYPTADANIPLATGVEAALIRAEAALQAGQPIQALTILNSLRARVDGLAPLTTANVDVLFRERAFWLFGTAHRLGDMRRLIRPPYDRPYAAVYPTGEYFKSGLEYGTEAELPIPFDEQNNPNFSGCISRDS